MKMERTYACIDLKSFYASVECKERELDPITTNLVVADNSRTDKTICLAVSPSLKSYGLSGRSRLYEVVQKVRKVNYERKRNINNSRFKGKSYNDIKVKKNKYLKLDYIVAPPRMALYIKYSTEIYNVYLKYLSPDDIFVYSIDEVFIDLTNYLEFYKMDAKELITKMIQDVYKTTGITATSGIGTNMYLAKVAMDIVAKHSEPDEYGVRLAELDEMSYRKLLWNHKPITDFWRVGKGYSKRLEKHNIYTMGDIARCSIDNEELLYKLFGINAELLIDHVWGYEPCTMKSIKSYKPTTNCLSSGQVLHTPYSFSKAKIIVREMMDILSLDLVDKKYLTDNITLTIGYDIENVNKSYFEGEVVKDFYGRLTPKPAHGTARINHKTSSSKILTNALIMLYNKIVDPKLTIRRVTISANNLIKEDKVKENVIYEQFDIFSDSVQVDNKNKKEKVDEANEKKIQKAMINIKNKYGKNAILKGMDLEEGATMIDRNNQIGGHKA